MLRLSYTALNYWIKGDTAGLIDYLNGKRMKPTPQMKAGLQFDDEACEMAVKEHKLPDHFGGFEVFEPIPQLKMETTIKRGDIEFQLVGVIDVYDMGMIYELKTGVTSSADYALTLQIPIYAMLLNHVYTKYFEMIKGEWQEVEPPGHPLLGARICRFNQYEGTTDIHHVLVSDRMMDSTYRKVFDYAEQISSFLREEAVNA